MRAAALRGFSTATDFADYLVKRSLTFYNAHETVAHAVRICLGRTCQFNGPIAGRAATGIAYRRSFY